MTNRVELLAAAGASTVGDRADSQVLALGDLRAIAGRANATVGGFHTNRGDGPTSGQLAAVRDALAAVDLALDLVRELPPDTAGPLVAALRKRLATAFDALAMVETGLATSR